MQEKKHNDKLKNKKKTKNRLMFNENLIAVGSGIERTVDLSPFVCIVLAFTCDLASLMGPVFVKVEHAHEDGLFSFEQFQFDQISRDRLEEKKGKIK